MLNSFRAFSGTLMVKIMMALLVVSFALWGVGDVLRQHGANAPVATVGSIKITPGQFAAALRAENEGLRQMMGAQYSPELAASMQLPQRVLQRLVQQNLLALEAKDIGIIPGDAEMIKRITENPNFSNAQGKFDKSQFQEILRRSGLSEKKYIERLRADMTSEQLSDLLSTSVSQPEIAARTLYEARKQQRTATLYTLPSSLVKNNTAPTDDNLNAYYKAHTQEFTVPEFRTLSYATIAPSDIPTDDVLAQKFLNNVEDAFAGGSTLNEAAKDFGLKVQNVGTVSRAGKTQDGKTASLPAYDKFLDAAFSTDEKSESQLLPIKSGGYFVVRVESIVPEHVRPLAEVKSAVAAGWEKQERALALGNLANEISEKFKNTETRAAAIKQYGLTGVSSGNIKRDDSMNTLPIMLVEDVFARGVGQSTGAFVTKNGDYMIAVVDSLIPASAPDKEAMRQMRATIGRDQKSEIAEEYFIYLEHKFPVEINVAALNAMTGAMTGQQ